MPASCLLAFWVVAALLIVVPGADWAFTISAGLRGRSVVSAVSGLIVGYAALTVVVAAGVGTLVAGSATSLTVLTVVGGLYLVWHGLTTFHHPVIPSASNDPATTEWNTLVKGIGVSGLNPKGLVLFLALLPQFTSPRRSWPVAGQIAALGLVFMLTCAVFYFCLGSFARTVLLTRPAIARAVSRFSATAMVVIGAVLIAERLVS